MSVKEIIENLNHGTSFIVPESDYGRAEIWMLNGLYFLFSIPAFGGTPAFEQVFLKKDIDKMFELMNSWT